MLRNRDDCVETVFEQVVHEGRIDSEQKVFKFAGSGLLPLSESTVYDLVSEPERIENAVVENSGVRLGVMSPFRLAEAAERFVLKSPATDADEWLEQCRKF